MVLQKKTHFPQIIIKDKYVQQVIKGYFPNANLFGKSSPAIVAIRF